MNEQDRNKLNEIVQLSPADLTDFQIDFLFARRDYLNKTQKKEFAEVLEAKAEAVEKAANLEVLQDEVKKPEKQPEKGE